MLMPSGAPSSDNVIPFPDRRLSNRRDGDRWYQDRERDMDAVRRICEALSQQISVDKLVEQALCTALEVVGAEAGSVLLAEPDAKQLVFKHVVGGNARMLRRTAMSWTQGLAGAVFTSGTPLVVPDVKQDPRHFSDMDEAYGYTTRDMIVLPLKRWEGEPIGVLEVLNKREGRLNDDDLAILSIISALTATMIEQARLFEKAKLAEWSQTLEQRVREQVTEIERLGRLKRFFSPPLVEAILSRGDEDLLKSHRREVTVVFLDLRGFTTFAEAAEPEEVMGVLAEYHAEMGRLIVGYQATLERFTGDGMMVFFNDPVPIPNAGEQAVRMALAMRELVVSKLHPKWVKLGYDLGLGVGIASGYATLGVIGFEGRQDYGAIGTVTNLAARLCGEAEPFQILVGRRFLHNLEDLVEAELVGELSLKGFQRPVKAYNIVALKQ